MSLVTHLIARFEGKRVEKLVNPLHQEQELILLILNKPKPIYVLMTSTLSDYEMPVLPKWKGREFNEICVCLPSYWDIDDTENPNYSWPFEQLFRLEKFAKEKNTWFGPGHTIPNGNPAVAISPLLEAKQFIFLAPIILENELSPLIQEAKTVYFLALVPLYNDELDFKMEKGTNKFVERFISRKNNECVDEYRKSMMNSRMRLF